MELSERKIKTLQVLVTPKSLSVNHLRCFVIYVRCFFPSRKGSGTCINISSYLLRAICTAKTKESVYLLVEGLFLSWIL